MGFPEIQDFDKISDILDKNSGKLRVFYYISARLL